MAQMHLRRSAYPGQRRALGARMSGDGKPFRPRKMLIEPIENGSKLFLLLSRQSVRPPECVGGPDCAAAMTIGRMPVVRYEPDEIAVFHGSKTTTSYFNKVFRLACGFR